MASCTRPALGAPARAGRRIRSVRRVEGRSWLASVALAGLVAAAPATAQDAGPSLAREGGFGAASALVSLLYGPVKLAYAVSGLALGLGSFLWTWGDQDAAMTVVAMSVGGDYVITPAHLGGADDIRFTGPEP